MPFAMPPGLRIPYDSDGTIGILHKSAILGGEMVDIHPNALAAMNSTMGGGMSVPTTLWGPGDAYDSAANAEAPESAAYFALLFPVPTRLRGIFIAAARDGNWQTTSGGTSAELLNEHLNSLHRVEVSRDTTNGLDGTWTFVTNNVRGSVPRSGVTNTQAVDAVTGAVVSTGVQSRPVKDYFRNLYADSGVGIQALSGANVRNIKGIRIYPLYYDSRGPGVTPYIYSYLSPGATFLHLYGEPDTGAANSHYLQGWRADSDMRLGAATLSWGDVPVGSSSDKTFRIKNMSDTLTANDVLLSVEDPIFYPSPSPAAQFVLSLDGIDWASTLTIGAIGPDTVSGVIHIRRVTPLNSPLTTYSPKIRFDAGSWS